MREAVILTVHNRDTRVIANTLWWLFQNDLSDTDVIVLNDRSDPDCMLGLKNVAAAIGFGDELKIVDMPDYDAYRTTDGHNNPAIANNRALQELTDEHGVVWFLSSDCMLPPNALSSGRQWIPRGIWVPRTVDIATGQEFCGSSRPFPMMWMVGMLRETLEKIEWFDEEYCKGMAFEDNDFMGRAGLAASKIIIDCSVTQFHQSHDQLYLDDGGE